MSTVEDGPVPAGMPWWCRVVIVVPVVVATLALVGSGGEDPFVVMSWAVGAAWVTGALARWALRRQGYPDVVAQRWLDKELEPPWLVVPLVAFAAWICVDSLRTALSPAGDWWSWVGVVLGGAFSVLMLAVAVGAFDDWRRRRAS